MGAGQYGFGLGPGGQDPVLAPSSPRNAKPPAALLFNGASRSFPLDANGRYGGIHPIDQKVALALILQSNTLASVPEIGNNVRGIRKIDRRTANKVRDEVTRALADMVSNGDIQVLSIEVETRTSVTGAILFAVTYTNLRSQKPKPRTFQVNNNGA